MDWWSSIEGVDEGSDRGWYMDWWSSDDPLLKGLMKGPIEGFKITMKSRGYSSKQEMSDIMRNELFMLLSWMMLRWEYLPQIISNRK